MDHLLKQILACQVCADFLPFPPKPVVTASEKSKIVLIGQAPGSKVQQSGIPWDDASGNLLREWLNVDKATFYNPDNFALIPMGFCYPGKGKSGDLPPRPECAPLWHQQLLSKMPNIQLTILIGQYSQKKYLQKRFKKNLTETVRAFPEFLPEFLPVPHPSPRNRHWLQKNAWFNDILIPELQKKTAKILVQ